MKKYTNPMIINIRMFYDVMETITSWVAPNGYVTGLQNVPDENRRQVDYYDLKTVNVVL